MMTFNRPHPDLPPSYYWLLPVVVATLRLIPFLASFWLTAPPESSLLRIGYMPEDTQAYLSFIRQVPDDGRVFFENRFTTTPQDGRFVLLFHWLVGAVSRAGDFDPAWVLELSRVPLTFLFFAALWWFLTPLLAQRRERMWAATLVAFSGGIDGFLKPLAQRLPEQVAKPFTVSAWHLYGWNTFESLYNPLWIAGFILMLVALRPLLQPVVPRRPVVLGGVALTVALLWFVHPHSAMVTIAVAATRPVFEWALRATVDFRRYVGLALALAVVGIFILAVTSWQMADPVYRDSAGQFFGTLRLDVFWYPLTLGLVLVQALRGATIWIRTRRPNGLPILAWIGTVIFLHSAPVINGYHFVPYLHLPLCVLAAAAMPKVGEHFMSPHLRTKGAAVVLMTALFGSFAFVTLESVTDVATRNRISLSHEGLIRELAGLPADRALVPPQLGNSVPAFTPHSVWAGHWALTRDFWPKVELYEHLTRDPARGDELKWLLESERIRYFVAPIDRSQRLGTLLSDRVEERRTIGELELFFMKSGH